MSIHFRGAATRQLEHHSPFARGVLVVVGLVIALFSAGLVLVSLTVQGPVPGPFFLIAAFFAGLSAYGGWLCWRGIRGTSVVRLVGGESFIGRYGHVLGIVMGAGIFVWRDPQPFTADWGLATSLLLLPVHLVLHELGHLCAGWLVGLRFESLGLGPVVARRLGGRLVWEWRGAGLHPGVDGWASVSPGGRGPARWRRAVFIAGGPLGNFATAALAAGLRSALTGPAGTAAALLEAVTLWGCVTGALNLVPLRLTGVSLVTDGASLLALLRSEGQPGTARFD